MRKKYNSTTADSMTVIFKMQEKLLSRFDAILLEKGLGRSEVIRSLINAYADAHECPAPAKEEDGFKK
jgi:metal-responsive CopG/Arc/MetJ family transcriptional regulator